MGFLRDKAIHFLGNNIGSVFFFALVTFLSYEAQGQTEKILFDSFNWSIWTAREKLSSIFSTERSSSPHCQVFYDQLIADGQIDISLNLGYMDVSPEGGYYYGDRRLEDDVVLDSMAKKSLIQILTQPCIGGVEACELRVIDENLLQKQIYRSDGRPIVVNLWIHHSSASISNWRNNADLVQDQLWQTQIAEESFFGDIEKGTEVVIYMGHARKGGGPDFSPPILRKNGHPDYAIYQKSRKGLKRLLSALDFSRQKPQLIGLLACNSHDLFVPQVQKKSPQSLLVSADALFNYIDIIPTGFAIVDSILARRCGKDFFSALRVQPDSAQDLRVSFLP